MSTTRISALAAGRRIQIAQAVAAGDHRTARALCENSPYTPWRTFLTPEQIAWIDGDVPIPVVGLPSRWRWFRGAPLIW